MPSSKKHQVACRSCGSVARPRAVKPHNWHLEFLLWFVGVVAILAISLKWIAIFIMPAFIYTLWRRLMVQERCRKCDSRYVYPIDSLTGKRIVDAGRS